MPMDVCHILLGSPWQFDRETIHEGKNNYYKFLKDGIRHTLFPLQEEKTNGTSNSKTFLLSVKEYLNKWKKKS